MDPVRLNRLFAAESGRCLNVAMDHGMFGSGDMLSGIEDLASAVDLVVSAGPDAVQLTTGTARYLQRRLGPDKPALVLRLDHTNVYEPKRPDPPSSSAAIGSVEAAVRLDAACVVVNLLDAPDAPELRVECVRLIQALIRECNAVCMPLMIEPLCLDPDGNGYASNTEPERVIALVRQAVELGADVIKADPTDPIDRYSEVVMVAGEVPVLVRGGGRIADDQLMHRTRQVIEQGARGVVYGRNIIAHPDPGLILSQLLEIVHSAEDER